MKNIFIGIFVTLAIFVLVGAAIVYIFRGEIFQYSAEAVLRKNLPDYMTVGSLVFDLKNGKLKVNDLAIKNPSGYDDPYLASIGTLSCAYKMRGKNMMDGIEITDITADRAVINIERKGDGRLNINEMGSVLASRKAAQPEFAPAQAGSEKKPSNIQNIFKGKDISDFLTLTDTVNIRDGKVLLLDRKISTGGYRLSFEKVNGTIRIPLSKDFRQVKEAATQGSGMLDGDPSQRISWVIWMDTQKSALTMSNRIELERVSLELIKPYYDPFSPIDIKRGTVSGTLVFDLDNGNIGSMNTLRLKNLRFSMKENSPMAGQWDMAIPDMVKYLQSGPDEITFDFKIKGNMNKPEFQPGPVVRQAIQSMTVDKISQAIQDMTNDGGDTGAQAEKSDTEKAVDAIKALFKK